MLGSIPRNRKATVSKIDCIPKIKLHGNKAAKSRYYEKGFSCVCAHIHRFVFNTPSSCFSRLIIVHRSIYLFRLPVCFCIGRIQIGPFLSFSVRVPPPRDGTLVSRWRSHPTNRVFSRLAGHDSRSRIVPLSVARNNTPTLTTVP